MIKSKEINVIGGMFCSNDEVLCTQEGDMTPCPMPGKRRCREELLDRAVGNYNLVGIAAFSFGGAQVSGLLS